MYTQFKKYLPLFFLFLFLFPMLKKGTHDLEHQSDIHCTATDKHYHDQEHSCPVCEFTLSYFSDVVVKKFQFYIPVQQFLFHPFVECIYVPDAFQYFPARAPPIA